MVGKVELDSTFPIIQTECRRRPGGDRCLHMSATCRRPIGDRVADRCRSYGNQALLMATEQVLYDKRN